MIISRITVQKKNKHRYNIFLKANEQTNESYGFSVEEESLIKFDLRKGRKITGAEIKQLQQFDTMQKAYARSIQYLGYRMRTEKEMRTYLHKLEVDDEQIDVIINRLYDEKLLDDHAFATAFVNMRMNSSTKGPKLVKKELVEKGVSEAIASEAILAFTFDVQYKKGKKVANKRLKLSGKQSFQSELQKLQAYFARNGYDSSVTREIINELKVEKAPQKETEAVTFQGEKALRRLERKYEGYDLINRLKQTLYRQGFSSEMIEYFIDQKREEEEL